MFLNLFLRSPTIGSHASKVEKHFVFDEGFSLSKPLLSKSLLWSDWSDDPVGCDWSTLLWLVRWSSLFWLVYSALNGPMTQLVVIGLLCSDWSDDPVGCDWFTLLWSVRWPSLLWLVYSVFRLVRWPSWSWFVYPALIGHMIQLVVICLHCSDWSDDPVGCDWSTLLWLVRWPSWLWLVYSALNGQMTQSVLIYSALIGQMTQLVVIGLLCSGWSDYSVCCDWCTFFCSIWFVSVLGKLVENHELSPFCEFD